MTMLKRGKDISTMFTKEENKKNGRLGYCNATREKRTIRIIDAKEEAVSELIRNGYLEEKSENVYKLPLFKETTGYGERDKQRHTKEYKKWRKEVLKRDNYICQMCGKPGSNIVHHKVRFRDCYDDESLVYDVENGVCLCKRCHKIAHGGGNYING